MSRLRWWILGFTAALWGCAATGGLSLGVPPTVALGQFKTVSVKVDSKVADSVQEAILLRSFIITRLRETGRWQVVDPPGELHVDAVITDLYKVSPDKRLFLGALAGQAFVDVDVELRGSGNAPVSRFKATGRSSGGTIFAGTTDQALRFAAEEIAGFISKH